MVQHNLSLVSIGCVLLLPLLSGAQESYGLGAPPHFAWGAYNKGDTDGFCFSSNPAALGRCRDFAAGLVGERPFNIAGLGRYRLSMLMPVSGGAIGLEGGFVSASPYREMVVALAYGRRLGNLLDLGVHFGIGQTVVPGYPPARNINAGAAIIMHLTSQLNAGWSVSIPYGKRGTARVATLPLKYSMGVGYDPGPSWSAAFELTRGPGSGTVAGFGFVYKPHAHVQLKMGFSTGGPPIWFGIGYQLRKFRLDVSASVHERLGFSPSFGLLTSFKKDQ